MFLNIALSIPNYDALLIGWNQENLLPNVTFGAGNSQFCEGDAARATIIANDSWAITDGGFAGAIINNLADQNAFGSFTLPFITGTNTSGNEAYFTGQNGTGIQLLEGDVIDFDPNETYPITIYIFDDNGTCPSEEEFLLSIIEDNELPNFFTPNGDTINDIWDISSIDDLEAQVFIFNKFGKLLIQLNRATDVGWDGQYRGKTLPETDYWYRVVLSNGNIQQGHFTLKR